MSLTNRDLVREALDFGFSHAGPLDAATLVPRDEVRAMCAADRCHAYNRSWVCPPACGTLEQCGAVVARYRGGLIVQTTAELDDPFDYETMASAGASQQARMADFREQLRADFPDMIVLGSGGCRLCPACTYPAQPCRHPHRAVSSMEAFGLVVTEVCLSNGLGYYYGPGTITYTGCYLFA